MMRAILQLAGRTLWCDVPTLPRETAVGLAEHAGLSDSEGMYFAEPSGRALMWMGAVRFPIDIIFFRAGNVCRIAENLQPRDPTLLTEERCSGVLEVRGGWSRDHGLAIGAPLRWVWP
jgi:uncharacterized membrane protein (UPF0127 family)